MSMGLKMSNAPTDDGLLPCPFCGSQPVHNCLPRGKIGQVYCTNVDCFGPKTTAMLLTDSIVQWNTRASAQRSGVGEPVAWRWREISSADDPDNWHHQASKPRFASPENFIAEPLARSETGHGQSEVREIDDGSYTGDPRLAVPMVPRCEVRSDEPCGTCFCVRCGGAWSAAQGALQPAIEAGAQALADDVWHPPVKLENMARHEANKFRHQSTLVLRAASSPPSAQPNSEAQ